MGTPGPEPKLRRRWRWLPWLAAAGFLCLFLSAGFWQLRRAVEKEKLFAAWAALAEQPLQTLDQGLANRGTESLVRVELEGEYLPGRNILLDNQTRPGRIGVLVYSPLRTPSGQLLLVARGFHAITRDRRTFPDPPVPGGPIRVRGVLAPPPAMGLRMAETTATASWPSLRTRIDLAELSQALGEPLLPSVLLLDPADPHGFERDWLPHTLSPERHRGYAVQWFGLAATVLIVTLLLSLRRTRP